MPNQKNSTRLSANILNYFAAFTETRFNFRTLINYRWTKGGKEQALILEYDGVEYHTKNPDIVTKHNFPQEYLDYDISRQIELESYGYRFLRLNKFNLRPEQESETKTDVLDRYLKRMFTA